MSIERWVKRYTKVILGGITVIMSATLILTFGPTSWLSGGREDESARPAGTFTDEAGQTITITKREFDEMKGLTRIRHKWDLFQKSLEHNLYPAVYPVPDEERPIEERTWEVLILLHTADLYGVHVDKDDVQAYVQGTVYRYLLAKYAAEVPLQTRDGQRISPYDVMRAPGNFFNADQFHKLLRSSLGEEYTPAFEVVMQNHLRIRNLLDLVTHSQFPTGNEVVDELQEQHKKIKIKYASFDPKDFVKSLKPASASKILQVYQASQKGIYDNYVQESGRYTSPDQIRWGYLFVPEQARWDYIFADFESYKGKVAEPSEEDMKKFYEEKKQDLYEIRAQQPQQVPQYKSYPEVRENIRNRLKLEKAERMVYDAMEKLNLEIGSINKPSKEVPLDELAKKYGMTYDCTSFLDTERISEFEKIIGGNSRLASEGFHLTQGEIASRPINTTKGFILYRLLEKKKAYYVTLVDDVLEFLTQRVQKDQQLDLARQKAKDVAKAIKEEGFDAATRKHKVHWETFGYIGTHTMDLRVGGGETLSREFLNDVLFLKTPTRAIPREHYLGEAFDSTTHDLAYVVYVEDVVHPSLKEIGEGFDDVKRGKLFRKRRDAEAGIIKEWLTIANLREEVIKEEKGRTRKH